MLTDELGKLAAAVSLDSPELHDNGEFAGRTFDYHADHPEFARLLRWEGLAGGAVADEVNRTAHYQNKVRAVAAAQQDGVLDDGLAPAHLMFLLIALGAWWFSVPQLAHMLTGAGADDSEEGGRRRAFVVQAAQRLAAPRRADGRSDDR